VTAVTHVIIILLFSCLQYNLSEVHDSTVYCLAYLLPILYAEMNHILKMKIVQIENKYSASSFRLCIFKTTVTIPPQSDLGRAHHSHTTTQQNPYWLHWDALNSPQNCPSLGRLPPLSNTPIIWPTPLTIPYIRAFFNAQWCTKLQW